MVIWQFLPHACTFAFVPSASYQLLKTCCDPAVLLVVSTGRMVFLLIQICNSLWGFYVWMSLQPWFKEFAQQQIEGCFGFIFTEDIQLFLLSASLLLRFLDCFRLANLWLNYSKRQVNVASQTLPVSMVARQSHIGYEYWKRRVWLVR